MDAARASAEIERLHDFIAGWFRGEGGDLDRDFAAALHPRFENIQPAGKVLTRDAIVTAIRAGRGANPEFRIAIEAPRLIAAWPESRTCLATYIEAQTGARNSAPENRRRATVLFEDHDGRLLWRHLQETGL